MAKKENKKSGKLASKLFVLVALIALGIFMVPAVFGSLKFGLDLQGGFEVLYEVSSLKDGEKVNSDMLSNTHKNLIKRIDTLGVSEPVIEIEGENRIRVQLAGVKDQEAAREILSKPAVLTFRDSNDNLLMTSDVLTGKGASIGQSNNNMPAVALSIAKKDEFFRVTNKISKTEDKLMVVWLDFEEGVDSYKNEQGKCGKAGSHCLSAATVSEGFASDVIIQGHFTQDEVKELVDFINSGNLPTKLTEISSTTRTASFGENSLKETTFAGIVAFVLVVAFMIIVYRFAGFVSSVGLLIYTVLAFGIFWLVGGVLTLPGIAAMLLGVGMAVDANVLSFARIKDELANGSSLQSAVKKGNSNSIKTIIDANVTTFLVALILFIFGESSVKGFATMLMISIFVTMIVMVVITRLMLRKMVETGFFDDKIGLFIGKPKKYKHINYMKKGKVFIGIALVCILAGIVSLFTNNLNLGVEFKGGTSININGKLTKEQVEEKLNDYTISSIDMNEPISVKITEELTEDKIEEVKQSFESEYNASTDINSVSNIVQLELIRNAVYSLLFAIVGIIIYISFRFKFSFGISSILALAHDVFIIFTVFSLLKLEVSTIFVAAILSIIGYSINNTIVVFDRIRENLHKKEIKNVEELESIVNDSINSTISRSIITTITTAIPVIALIFLGSKEILNFNIALLIGLIAGTYSSILLAGKIWVQFEKKNIGKKKTKKWYEEDGPVEKSIKGINS